MLAYIVASWVLGVIVVRVGLDAVDRREYSSTSEILYVLVAITALSLAVSGSTLAIRNFRRG